METITVRFDGGSRGNPGPAGIGVVLEAADGTVIFTLGRFIGVATNNVAEYKALITGLEQASTLGATHVLVMGDSELVIKQMKGQYRVKNPGLKPLYEQAKAVCETFRRVQFDHTRREGNKLTDKLANLAMDRKQDVTEA
ncbi:MAG: ribonuclease HI family protein [Phycisphaerae bacterium]